MRPTLILDSNALHTPRVFDSKQWKWLIDKSSEGHFNIAIPKVVKLELERQWQNRVADLYERIEALVSELAKYTSESFESSGFNVFKDEMLNMKIVQQIFKNDSIKLLEVPRVSHEELLDRDLARRKPFSSDGRGYRDSLIWHSIIEFLEDDHLCRSVYFISNNGDDFAKRNALHPSLLRDVPDGCEVELHKSIWSFREKFEAMLNAQAIEYQSSLDELVDVPREFDFTGAVEGHILAELQRSNIEDIPWLELNGNLFDVEVVDHVVQFVEDQLVDSLDDSTSIYSVRFEVDLSFRALVDIENYHEVSGEVALEESSPDPQYVVVSFDEQASGFLDMRLEADRETYEFL